MTVNWKWIPSMMLAAIIIYLWYHTDDGWAAIWTMPVMIICVLLIIIVWMLPF